jgi:hypothetical protein
MESDQSVDEGYKLAAATVKLIIGGVSYRMACL